MAFLGFCGESFAAPSCTPLLDEEFYSCGSSAAICPWEVEFRALFLRPSSDNLHYAVETLPLPITSQDWKIKDIKPDYYFGFDLTLKSAIVERNAVLSLSWEHFHIDHSAFKDVSEEDIVRPLFEIGPDATIYKKTKGMVSFRFDSVRIDYGLNVDLNPYLKSNIFVGIDGTRIKQTLVSSYSSENATKVRTIKAPSTFSGVGPQLGIDFSYGIWRELYLSGEAAASLLAGTQKTYSQYKAHSPALKASDVTSSNKQLTDVPHRHLVVPAFSGRLGVGFSVAFCRTCTLSLQGGYQAQVYLNAIQTVDINSTVGVYARNFHRTLSNFSLSGPYLGIDVAF